MLDYSTVVIKGSEGVGKSASLAHWVVTVANGDEEMGKGIFTHFVGCTPESLRDDNVLKRIIAHYSKVLGISIFDIIPDYLQDDGIFGYWTHNRIRPGSSPVESLDAISRLETEAVLSCLNDFMLVAARKAKEKGIKIIIVVDGIENLETDLETYVLRHLGLLIPEIRVILSFGGGVNGQDLSKRFMAEFRSTQNALRTWDTCENKEVTSWVSKTQLYFPKQELHEEADVVCVDLGTLPTVSKEQHQRAMVDLLVQYGRKIDEPKTAVLLAAIKPSGPPFIRTLLWKVWTFIDHPALTAMFRKAGRRADLFEQLLVHMGEQYGQTLMKWTLGLISCAQDGITEQELLETLMIKPDGEKLGYLNSNCSLPPFTLKGDEEIRNFTQLVLGIREMSCCMYGPIQLFETDFKEAVVKIVGGTKESQMPFRRRLAQYFGTIDKEGAHSDELARQILECLHQLCSLADSDELAKYLSGDILKVMLEDRAAENDLRLYLRRAPDNTVLEYLLNVVQDKRKGIATCVDELNTEKRNEMEEFLKLMALVADVLLESRHAERYETEMVNIREDELLYNTIIHGEVHEKVSISCINLARAQLDCNYYGDTSKLVSRALNIDKTLYGQDYLRMADCYEMSSRAECQEWAVEDKRDYPPKRFFEAQASLFLESLRIKVKCFGKLHLDTAQTAMYLGQCYEDKGAKNEANKWFRRCFQIRRELLGDHPCTRRAHFLGYSISKPPRNKWDYLGGCMTISLIILVVDLMTQVDGTGWQILVVFVSLVICCCFTMCIGLASEEEDSRVRERQMVEEMNAPFLLCTSCEKLGPWEELGEVSAPRVGEA